MAGILAGLLMWMGIIGFGLIIVAAIVWLIFSARTNHLKKKIPEEIKKEVEDGRKEREKFRTEARERRAGEALVQSGSPGNNKNISKKRSSDGRSIFQTAFD